MSTCLLIVDVQHGFLTNDTMHIPERIKNLVESRYFDHIVATRFVNSEDSPHYIFTQWTQMMDSESQQLDEYVESVSEIVFDKNTNSCFSEEFMKYLNDNNISQLSIVGIDTDCCVMKTAFDCFDYKIPFEVLTECCASTGGYEFHKAACAIMRRNLGKDMII